VTGSHDEEDFAALLEEFEGKSASPGRGPKVGDVIQGRVISISADAVFVELGGKSEGMLELDQVTDSEGKLICAVGDEIEARVVDAGGRSGCVVLRRTLSRGPEARAELAEAQETGLPVEGLVSAVNKGGVEVQVAGLRGFCPMSQLDLRFVEDPGSYVGQRLTFRVTRYELGRGNQANLVLSRRALLEEEQAAKAAELRARLEVGAVLDGTVVTLKPYGAFVDLGGLEGMLHVSELGFGRVGQPSDVLSPGQRIKVQVLKIEAGERGRGERISLSLKALERDPWLDAVAQFPAGTRARGQVVRIQPFGAFIELAPGVEGLVHVSEMGGGGGGSAGGVNPRTRVKVGQEVEVKVLALDLERRRISLSMDEAARDDEAADEDMARQHAPRAQGLGTLGDLLKKKRR
jgi:small subunit ribosomal protein S1